MSLPQQQPPSTPLTMFRTIVGIGMVCALVIVLVFEATAGRIAENEARALRKAVDAVMPGATELRPVSLTGDGLADAVAAEVEFPAFLGYDANGALLGAAITASGMGYQDTIRVIYAYSFEQQAIVGMRVLQSLETPGLGDKIETDPAFVANFEQLDVSLDAAGTALQNPVVTVPHGTKEHPWQIDAITGATVSSDAIGAILNDSASEWAPLLVREHVRLQRSGSVVE
ncbi:MAG: FMN-binding protein [Gammaproteobacteria bacterium]|nr:FMN-binding protein [Gammaproteobacteria bacterium]